MGLKKIVDSLRFMEDFRCLSIPEIQVDSVFDLVRSARVDLEKQVGSAGVLDNDIDKKKGAYTVEMLSSAYLL